MTHQKSRKKTNLSPKGAAYSGLRPQTGIVIGICAVLVLLCLAIYAQTYLYDFVIYDDGLYITGNPQVQAGLTLKSVGWAFVTDKAGYFHPLTWMSHLLDCSLYGMHAGGHHVTSLIFHAAASVLLFLALRLLTGVLWPSAAVAALFAVHPLHVESVAWIAERKDVLSAFFWMLALGAYALYVRRRGVLLYVAVATAFVLGLMSKPMVVTLPFVLLLLDYWPLNRINRDASFGVMAREAAWLSVEKIPLFLITFISAVSTFVMQAQANNMSFGDKVPYLARCANAAVVYVIYLMKTVCPLGLAAFYPHPITRPVWQVAGSAAILAAITLFCLWQFRRRPYLIVGWLWYLGTLVPVIELVQAGTFSHADRYTYIPLIGVFIMVVWGAVDLIAAWHVPTRVVAVASSAILLVLTTLAVVQTGYWRNTTTLFGHAIAVGQESGMAYYNLGFLALEQKRYDEAKIYLTKSLALDPQNRGLLNNLGMIAMNQNHYSEAKAYFIKALEVDPKYTATMNNLGLCLMNQEQYEAAQGYFRKALELDPHYALAMGNLSSVLSKLGKQEEADEFARKAAELNKARNISPSQ